MTTLIIENGYCLFSPISSADLFVPLKGLLVQYSCMIHRVSPSGESPKIRILKFGAFSIISVVTVHNSVELPSDTMILSYQVMNLLTYVSYLFPVFTHESCDHVERLE